MNYEIQRKPPREVPLRDDFYMGQAFWWASKSKDPSTQCGAIIVATNNEPLGIGYNGPPRQMDDNEVDWDRPQKYPIIVHAEANAIDHSDGTKLPGSTIYVTAKPCDRCMLEIVRKKIKKVVYYPFLSDPKSSLGDETIHAITDMISRLGKVEVVEFKGDLTWMEERMDWMRNLGLFSGGPR